MVLQLFVNGPPGSGKTTLAKLLCDEFNLELIATGDLLRENMKAQTSSGRRAQRCIAAKTLVPDRVVLDMVEDKVAGCTVRGRVGWVLDSFPRTTDQAKALMAVPKLRPEIVLLLEVPEQECVARIVGRRFDPVTGAIFHSPNNLPRDANVRSRLTKRRDDTSEKLSPRFEAYRTFGDATNALFDDRRGVVHRIDASKSPAAILEDVSSLLHSLVAQPSRSSINISNQVQHSTKVDNKHFQQRPETIPETDEEDDDDMQQYQYDWEEDDSPISSSQRGSPQKQSTPAKQLQRLPDRKVPVAVQKSEKTTLSSAFMVALPLPDLPSRQDESNNDEGVPPPPAPMLRPLPTPTGRFKGLSAPSEVRTVNQSTDDNISVRSSSSSSVGSSTSTTTLEAAAASVDMETFKELLLDGFDAVKHGRRGRPHPRLIFADLEFKRVFWQKAMGPTDRVGKGKHAKLEQSVVLSDVIQVARGMKTSVLKRSGNLARYECYVSLVTPTRTLDLELPTPQLADFLQRGFEQLLHG